MRLSQKQKYKQYFKQKNKTFLQAHLSHSTPLATQQPLPRYSPAQISPTACAWLGTSLSKRQVYEQLTQIPKVTEDVSWQLRKCWDEFKCYSLKQKNGKVRQLWPRAGAG